MTNRIAIAVLTLISLPAMLSAQTPRDADVDAAVTKALAYLRQGQNRDGYWQSPGFGAIRSPGVTGLAIMAFLSAGHTPTEGEHAPAVAAGVRWVLKQQQPSGLIAAGDPFDMYHHGICTLMLAEAIGMTDAATAPKLREALTKAIQIILRAQRISGAHRGGWRYTIVGTDGDLSVTGWQLLALRAAKNVGCDVPSSAVDRAMTYVKSCYDETRGAFAYMPANYLTVPCTGTGILCLELAGKDTHNARESQRASGYILRNPPTLDQPHCFYGLYYCSQAMFQLGGNYWESYRPKLHDLLLKNQQRNGAWIGRDLEAQRGGIAYSTAMGVLALTVEYRLLPIYQRGEDTQNPGK